MINFQEEPRLAIEDLVQMYVDREELATISEQKTDNILDDVEEEVQEIDPKVLFFQFPYSPIT